MGWRAVCPPRRTWWWGRGALCLASGWLSVLGPRRYPRLPARPGEAGGPCIPTHSAAHGPAHGPLGRPPPHPRAWESVPRPQVQARSEALWAGHPGRVLLSDSWTRHLGLQAGQGGLSHEGPAGREGGKAAAGPVARVPSRQRGGTGGRCVRSTLARPGGLRSPSLAQGASLGSSHPPPSQPGSPVGSLELPRPLPPPPPAPAGHPQQASVEGGWEQRRREGVGTKQNSSETRLAPPGPRLASLSVSWPVAISRSLGAGLSNEMGQIVARRGASGPSGPSNGFGSQGRAFSARSNPAGVYRRGMGGRSLLPAPRGPPGLLGSGGFAGPELGWASAPSPRAP